MVSFLSRKESTTNRRKLVYELTKLQQRYEEQETEAPVSPVQTSQPKRSENGSISTENPKQNITTNTNPNVSDRNSSNSDVNSSGASSGIKLKIEQTRIEKYRFRSHLHGKLHQCATDQDRYEIAKQIIALQPELRRLNKDLDEVNKGIIPSRYIQKTESASDYVKIKNLKLYISRYQSKIDKNAGTPEDVKKWTDKLNTYKTELENLL